MKCLKYAKYSLFTKVAHSVLQVLFLNIQISFLKEVRQYPEF